jgi:hypothetical protein
MSRSLAAHPGRLLALGIALFSLVLMLVAPQRELFFDDAFLAKNLPTDLWDLPYFLSQRYWIVANHALFRPVVGWTLAMNQQVGALLAQLTPLFVPSMAYRVFNILLHATACYVLYIFALRQTKERVTALLATVLFAVQAFHTEAIGLAVNRSEILGYIFGSLFVMQHQAQKRLWLSVLFLLLAIGSKESAIVWICVALFLDVAARDHSWKKILFTYPAYIACSVGWFYWHRFITEGQGAEPFSGANPLLGSSLWERMPSIIHAQTRYLQNLVFPEATVTDFHYPLIHVVSWSDPYTLIGLLLASLTGVLLLAKHNWRTTMGQSLVCYAACQAPNANVFALVGPMIAERLVYPSSAFFSIFAALALARARGRWPNPRLRFGLATVVSVWVACQATYSAIRLSKWSTGFELFRQSAQSAPDSGTAVFHYAMYLKSRTELSEEYGRTIGRALQLSPNSTVAHNELGQFLLETSTDRNAVCRGYQHLKKAYLGEPFPSLLPGIATEIPAFRIRAPQTVKEELRACGITLSIDEAKAIISATRALLDTETIDPKTGKTLPCDNVCYWISSVRKRNESDAKRAFLQIWNANPSWGYLKAFLLYFAYFTRSTDPSLAMFPKEFDFESEWQQYCASIGYTLSSNCRESFKIGLDGVPWSASPLRGKKLSKFDGAQLPQ